MEEGLLPAKMPGFWGGLILDQPQDELLPYQLGIAKNILLLQGGSFRVRGGTKKVNAISFGGKITSGYRFYWLDDDGPHAETLIQCGNDVYRLNMGTGAWSLLNTATTRTRLTRVKPLKWGTAWGKAVATNGRIYTYDGETFSQVSTVNTPKGVRWCENLDRVWATDEDNPSDRVCRSGQYDATSWGATDFTRLKMIHGDRMMDVCTMSGSWILALKERSVHRIEGSSVYDLADYALSEDPGCGCLGDTLASIQGTAVWLSPNGVRYYNEAAENPFLNLTENKINSRLFLHHQSMMNQSFGCYYPKANAYLLCTPGDQDNLVWVIHFGIKGSSGLTFPVSQWVLPFKPTAMWVMAAAEDNGQLCMGDDEGYVYLVDYEGNDDGSAIAWEVETAYSSLTDSDGNSLPDYQKGVRLLHLLATYNGAITAQLKADWDDAKTVSRDSAAFASAPSGVWGDGAVWSGGVKWVERYAQSQRLRYMGFNGRNIALNLSGSAQGVGIIRPPVLKYYPRDVRFF